jgi:integrase
VRQGLLPGNPASAISIKKKESLPVFLTLEEVQQLARTECPNATVKAAFLFSCFSGLRYSDVSRLKWENAKSDHIQFSQAKTGGEELLPLSKQASDILAKQKNRERSDRVTREVEEGLIFALPRQSTVDKELKRWAKLAGIKKTVSFHKARHTFATLSLTSDIDIYTVSKLLGHKNLQTTQVYARVVDERKKNAVSKLPVLDA